MELGIDIGGTRIKAGLVSNNKILKKITVDTGKTKKEIIDNIISLIKKLDNKQVKLIGIGVPGPADYKKGMIGKTPNLPLTNTNLKKIIEKNISKKVIFNNDANCFVLGESIRLKKKNVVGLTLGTGVGGGIVINGELYQGKGNAGELGHCTIKYDGKKSKCGNNGCLEQYVSANALLKKCKKYPCDIRSNKTWAEYGKVLGIGLSNISNTFDPDVIVLGGGISNSFNRFKVSMNKEFKKRSLNHTNILKGKQDSNIIGAVSYAKKEVIKK